MKASAKIARNVHFELDLVINDRYAAWHKRTLQTNAMTTATGTDKTLWASIPWRVLVAQKREGANSVCCGSSQNDTELCQSAGSQKRPFPGSSVIARSSGKIPKRKARAWPATKSRWILTALPFELIPRTASEFKSKSAVQLLSVNDAEYHKNPGRRTRDGRREAAGNYKPRAESTGPADLLALCAPKRTLAKVTVQ
jgi:hypothetical protein